MNLALENADQFLKQALKKLNNFQAVTDEELQATGLTPRDFGNDHPNIGTETPHFICGQVDCVCDYAYDSMVDDQNSIVDTGAPF